MTASSIDAQKIMALKRIHADFMEIMKHEKCRTCSCFYGDVLNSVYYKIEGFREIESDRDVIQIKNAFERWIQQADLLKAHG